MSRSEYILCLQAQLNKVTEYVMTIDNLKLNAYSVDVENQKKDLFERLKFQYDLAEKELTNTFEKENENG